jgi:PAS domain S-box-containing protein
LLAGVVLAFLTWMCFQLHLNLATTGFVYLIAILLFSLRANFISSAVLSIMAVACLDYFFAPPIFSFRIDDPLEFVLVVAFLLTTLTVAGLVESARNQAEAALRAEARAKHAERELRLAIDAIPALVWTALPDGSLDYINLRWEEIGLSLDDLRGAEWTAVIHPDDRAEVMDRWRIAVETGTPHENIARVRRGDGEYRWFLSRARPLRDEVGQIVRWFGTHTDIEERMRAEVALRESEQRFRDYAETASDWFWETGPDHRFIRVSGQLAAIGINPGLRTGVARWDDATDRDEEPEKWRLHVAALEAYKPFRGFRYRTTDGNGAVLHIATSGKPFFDPEGQFLGYRGVSSDVTVAVRAEQAEAALQRLRAEFAHATRVTTLGELTASIAHEVNQPLAAIVANAEACLRWLDREPPDLDEARHAAERIVKDGGRAGEVTRRVRALLNKADTRMASLDINDVVEEAVALVQRELFSHGVSLRMELTPALPLVLADRIHLQQVIINLVINGIEAMQAATDRPRKLVIRSQQDEGYLVLVTVEDCGDGISTENADRLFDAFFTTKSSGMGMGLSICRSIIEAHGGRVWAAPRFPRGAAFHFTLPIHQEVPS